MYQYNKSMNTDGHIGNPAAKSLGTIRPDGLASCLYRIADLVGELDGTTEAISRLADRIGGAPPATSGVQAGQPTMPEASLFVARQIEEKIMSILARLRDQANRIEDAIG